MSKQFSLGIQMFVISTIWMIFGLWYIDEPTMYWPRYWLGFNIYVALSMIFPVLQIIVWGDNWIRLYICAIWLIFAECVLPSDISMFFYWTFNAAFCGTFLIGAFADPIGTWEYEEAKREGLVDY